LAINSRARAARLLTPLRIARWSGLFFYYSVCSVEIEGRYGDKEEDNDLNKLVDDDSNKEINGSLEIEIKRE
jgi:hypothetical protein